VDSALQRELRKRIEAFVTDLEGLVRRAALQAVAQALGGSVPARAAEQPARRGRPKKGAAKPSKPSKPAPKKRVRRTAADLERTAAAILDHVSKHPGQGAEEIKAALHLATAAWALPIKKLVDEGRIVTRGAKRSTTYAAK
jgi:hypothetical protein